MVAGLRGVVVRALQVQRRLGVRAPPALAPEGVREVQRALERARGRAGDLVP